jgi:hypothetical protein
MANHRTGVSEKSRRVGGEWERAWGVDRGGVVRMPGTVPQWLFQQLVDIADWEKRSPSEVNRTLIWLGWGVYRALVRQLSHQGADGPSEVWRRALAMRAELEQISRAPWGGSWEDES